MNISASETLLDLSSKAAIITRAPKGTGWGSCYRLAEAGAKVLVADMDEALKLVDGHTFLSDKTGGLSVEVFELMLMPV